MKYKRRSTGEEKIQKIDAGEEGNYRMERDSSERKPVTGPLNTQTAIVLLRTSDCTGAMLWWKWTTDYNRCSRAETFMYRIKQLFGGSLTLRAYDGQVAEALAMARALNKMTKASMPESVRIA